MSQSRTAIPDFPGLYRAEHLALRPNQVEAMFADGRRWRLGDLLAQRGLVVFPHAPVADCGHHVAAAVEGVLDSGADKVLVIGVLHAWTTEMELCRARVAQGEDLSDHPLRGLQGPTLSADREEWRMDHSLIGWRYFWAAACARRKVANPPQVREVYPFLAGAEPASLPYYAEVARWAEDAVIVATADPFHHGIGYGDDPQTAKGWDDGGRELARAGIEESYRLLAQGDYRGYLQHCVATRNDARDTGSLWRALRGPMEGTILDLGWSDITPYYRSPAPTWVATALSTWLPV